MGPFGKLNIKNLVFFILTFFGSGIISKKMPGTIGSLFATVLLFFMGECNGLILFSALLCFLSGLFLIHYFLIVKKFDENRDPSYIVLDEACAIFLGAFVLNLFKINGWFQIVTNLILFRIFDIWKPFPIKLIEAKLKKNKNTIALGIMIDDVIAVIYATVLQILLAKLVVL